MNIIDGYVTLGDGLSRDDLIRQMDACGISRAVIGPKDHEFAVHNREGNERLSAAADDRLIATCTVTPWQGDAAPDMLKDAVAGGAKLLVLAPSVQGFMVTDPIVDPLLEQAAALNVAVYVHTGPHSMGAPTQVMLAAQKHPQTRFILAHGGSTDHAWDMGAIVGHHMRDNLWLETSFVRPWAAPQYIKAAGADRVIYASAAPRTDMAFELNAFSQALAPSDHSGYYGQNLLQAIGEAA